MIINIFGSSGSGSTTLAHAIAKTYNFNLIDVDDFLWKKTENPFTEQYSNQEAKGLISEELKKHKNNVISGSLVNICDDLKDDIDLFVYMNLDINVRCERITKREIKRFGDRVLEGGDLYDMHMSFLEWVSNYDSNSETMRSRRQHLLWIDDVKNPVLKITEELSIDELLKLVKPYIKESNEGNECLKQS